MRRMKRSQRAFAIGIALVAILGWIGSAPAQLYPSRPITMIVPYPAGGLFDALARILAEPMRGALAQTVVIENVGGAGGSIAVGRVARAAPDGYTVAIGSADQFVVNAAIYSLPYDVVNDFEPVALLISGPILIVTKTAVPATNLKELMAWRRQTMPRLCRVITVRVEPSTYVASNCNASSAQAGNSYPIAALLRRCRTWSADASM